MDAVQEHLREHYKLYAGIFLVLLPPVVLAVVPPNSKRPAAESARTSPE